MSRSAAVHYLPKVTTVVMETMTPVQMITYTGLLDYFQTGKQEFNFWVCTWATCVLNCLWRNWPYWNHLGTQKYSLQRQYIENTVKRKKVHFSEVTSVLKAVWFRKAGQVLSPKCFLSNSEMNNSVSGGVKLLWRSLTHDWGCSQYGKAHGRHSVTVKSTVHGLCYRPCGAVALAAQEGWDGQEGSTMCPACVRLEAAPPLLCWLTIPNHWGRLCLLDICSQST